MKWVSWLAIFSGAFFICCSPCSAQPADTKSSLDALIDWNDPWNLTLDKVRAVADAVPHKKSVRAYEINSMGPRDVIRIGAYYSSTPTNGNLSLFGGQLRLEGMCFEFEKNKPVFVQFCVGATATNTDKAKSASAAEVDLLKSELTKRTGDTMPRRWTSQSPPASCTQWKHARYTVTTTETTLGRLVNDRPKVIKVVLVVLAPVSR